MSRKQIDLHDLSLDALHDALLRSMAVDYRAKTVAITVEFYESKEDGDRKSGLIFFEGVESVSQMNNFDALESNAFAGHVTQWVPAKGHGTTYIDVSGGGIAINAKKVVLELEN
jgi:hypothetical protein